MLLSTVLFALGTAYEGARFLGLVQGPMPSGFLIPLLGLFSMFVSLRYAQRQTHDAVPQLSEEMLREYAYHDSLTKLPNRLLLQDRLTFQLASIKRTGHQLALHMIDLDGFKQANDTMGHRMGDELLVQVGLACVPRAAKPILLRGWEEMSSSFSSKSKKTRRQPFWAIASWIL